MNAAKPPIYRSREKGGRNYNPKIIEEKKSFGTLRRNLSIPNVGVSSGNQELCVPGILERSSSLTSLNVKEAKLSTKSLSTSNLLALSDPNLSIQEAKPKRFYDSPTNNWAKQKSEYVAHAQMYFYQLTEGCGSEKCKNMFCKSCKGNFMHKFSHDVNIAAMISTELAKNRHKYLCRNCKKRGKVFPEELLDSGRKGNLPFLCLISTTSPFRSLFLQSPLVSSKLTEEIMRRNRSVSQGDLRLEVKNQKSYRDTFMNSVSHMAGALSSSISCLLTFQQSPAITLTESSQDQLYGGSLYTSRARKVSKSQTSRIFGSDNYVANEFHELTDFENAVASEMGHTPSKLNTNEFSLTHLTLEMVEHILEDFLECRDSSFMLNTFRTVFSSSESLNLSFIDSSSLNYSSELNGKEVNIKDARLAYERIQSCDNGTFLSTILDSIRVLCSEMADTSQSIEYGNQFVIILELPMFFETELPYIFVDIFKSLSPLARNDVIKCFSRYDKVGFQRILKGFQSLLTSVVMDKIVADKNILSLCSILGILYEANCYSDGVAHIVGDSEFYNEKLSRCLDIKKEYQHWQSVIHPNIDSSGLLQGSWSNSEVSSSILQYSFLLKPETKVHVIHFEAINEMRKEYQTAIVHQAKIQTIERVLNVPTDYSTYPKDVWSAMCPYLVLEVRREFLVEDALEQLQKKMRDLKKPLKIKYIGGGEQGLDMGGLQKEFFQLGVEKLFDPAYGMFVRCDETRVVWFNSQSFESDAIFELTGMILGLAIYNGIILDVPLPDVLYSKLKGQKPTLENLWDIEPTIASSLRDLLNYEGNVEEDFCLDFQIVESYLGSVQSIDLLHGGKNVTVTRKNRQLYVDLYVHYLLTDKVTKQFNSFANGFSKVCNGDAIRLFRPKELELLICGSPEIDFSQLEKVTTYVDGFTEEHPLIKRFWSIVDDFSHEQKKNLLSFVTGSDRVPLSGLTSISFIIQRNGPDTENLPTSMTCFNRLLLPEYTVDKLREKLLIAIENAKGFGLT